MSMLDHKQGLKKAMLDAISSKEQTYIWDCIELNQEMGKRYKKYRLCTRSVGFVVHFVTYQYYVFKRHEGRTPRTQYVFIRKNHYKGRPYIPTSDLI